MRWSKVRKLVEESFAGSVRGRVRVQVTNRRPGHVFRGDCGYGWIEVDGRRLAFFDTHASNERFRAIYHEASNVDPRVATHPAIPDDERTEAALVEPGEFSREDFGIACWEHLHSSVNDSLRSGNPLIVSLAVLNARVRASEGRKATHSAAVAGERFLACALLATCFGSELGMPVATGTTTDESKGIVLDRSCIRMVLLPAHPP